MHKKTFKKRSLSVLLCLFGIAPSVHSMQFEHSPVMKCWPQLPLDVQNQLLAKFLYPQLEGFELETLGEDAKLTELLDWFEKSKFELATKLKAEMDAQWHIDLVHFNTARKHVAEYRHCAFRTYDYEPDAYFGYLLINKNISVPKLACQAAICRWDGEMYKIQRAINLGRGILVDAIIETAGEDAARGFDYFISRYVHELVALSDTVPNLVLIKITDRNSSNFEEKPLRKKFRGGTPFYTEDGCEAAWYVFSFIEDVGCAEVKQP